MNKEATNSTDTFFDTTHESILKEKRNLSFGRITLPVLICPGIRPDDLVPCQYPFRDFKSLEDAST
ncbi:hypothetical protein BpHYR1_020619 [Brachionus plicatilis]|uniref:Uncharacterized protein n=1 Tax=Brachionus plicatilis TaxID=10195 RepID=A0A3M7PRF1_BRAPC|nr:hypothetical protein BpHYR1_020619 [Brachionus plicatilis]